MKAALLAIVLFTTLAVLVPPEQLPSSWQNYYHYVFGEGRDVAGEWPLFCARLGVGAVEAATLIADPAVKKQLMDNTAHAAAQGVFGVPTLVVRGENFWGSDTIAWCNAFVDQPRMFEAGEMKRAAEIGIGAARKEVG